MDQFDRSPGARTQRRSARRDALWIGVSICFAAAAVAEAAPQSREQQACILTANKQATSLARVRSTETSTCMNTTAKLIAVVDVDACNASDPKLKVAGAEAKATDALTGPESKCATEPDFGFSSSTDLIDECDAATSKLFTDVYSTSVPARASTGETKCLATSLKGTAALLRAKLIAFSTCKKTGLKSGAIDSVVTLRQCLNDVESDPKGKVDKAAAKLEASVGNGDCTDDPATYTRLFGDGACSASPTPSALAACIEDRADCRACSILSATDALGADCDLFDDGLANSSCTAGNCGDGFKSGGELCDSSDSSPANQMCPNSGNGLEECSTFDCTCECPGFFDFTPDADDLASLLDNGWTGLGHDERWISNATVTVAVTSCDNASKPCGNCTFEGPVANRDADSGDIDNQRCTGDTFEHCLTDVDCAMAGGTCEFFFGAPLPLTNGGVPACVLQQISGSITGTVDVSTGDSASSLDVNWKVYSGILPTQPCPRCTGDGSFNDGIATGTCSGGDRNGLSCDANANSPIVGFGPLSLDCPPAAANNLSGAGLGINLDTSTGSEVMTLAAASPDCRAMGLMGEECFCDVCEDGLTACSNDADCVAASLTTCGNAFGQATRPNDCTNPAGCTDQGGNEGDCTAGPFDKTCDGTPELRLPCSVDADCAALNAFCPGGNCGLCTVLDNRECFHTDGTIGDQLIAVGAPDVPANETSMPTLATTTCVGPTSNAGVNTAAGLPGPLRLNLRGLARALPAPPGP